MTPNQALQQTVTAIMVPRDVQVPRRPLLLSWVVRPQGFCGTTIEMSLYHTNSHGPDEAAVKRAVSQAASLAQQVGHNTCRIAVHTKGSFLKGVFSKVFGDTFVTAVASNNGGVFQRCRFFLMTQKIVPSAPSDSPIIASHVSPSWREALIAARGDAALIYLPWMEDELQAYLSAHPNSQAV